MGRLVAPRRSDRVWVIAWGLALLPLGRMMVLVGGMACVLGHWLAGRMAARLGGGLTGDTYGALNVLVETATLSTSYVVRGDLVANAHALRHVVDDIELVLFDTGQVCNYPTTGEIRTLARLASQRGASGWGR